MIPATTQIRILLAEKAEIYKTPISVYKNENYFVEIECSRNGLGISDAQFDIMNAIEDSELFNIVDWRFEQKKDKTGKLTIEFTIDELFNVIIKDIKRCEDEIQKLEERKRTLEKML